MVFIRVTRAFCRVPSTSFSQAPWILYLPTCVGLGTIYILRLFQELFHSIFNPIRKYYLHDTSTLRRYRNINLFPITTHFCLALGSTNPAQINFTQETLDFGGVSHTLIATHVSIRTSDTSNIFFKTSSTVYRTSAAPCNYRNNYKVTVSANGFSPVHLRRGKT